MKLNVIFLLRTINSTKLQGIHFCILDINVSGNQGAKFRAPEHANRSQWQVITGNFFTNFDNNERLLPLLFRYSKECQIFFHQFCIVRIYDIGLMNSFLNPSVSDVPN